MKKMFTSMFLVLTLLALTAGSAFAQTATSITGTVQSVVLETNTVSGKTIAIVTILDETTNMSQTVKLSHETALTLGLIAVDPITGESIVATDAVGKVIIIDTTTVLPEDNTPAQHPVGSALSDFFSGLMGVNYETIMTYHEEGVGFGVIAKALWLTSNVNGDTATFEALLDAKQSGDFSAITLADGSTPTTWGDVVKSLKKGNNLGSVMSGKDNNNQNTAGENVIDVPANGQGKNNNGPASGNGNADNHDNGGNNGNGNGNGHGNGNGGGRP